MCTARDVMVLGWGFVNAKSRWSTTELSDSLMPGPQTPALLVTLGMVSLSETHAMLALLPMFPLQVNAQETCPSSSRMEEAADSRHSRMGQVLALGTVYTLGYLHSLSRTAATSSPGM